MHDLVIHGAAIQRVRVGDEGDAAWCIIGRQVQRAFERTGNAIQGKILCLCVHGV
ncbi:hypothetical protein D3C81_1708050 [compost metagenome]